MKENKVSSKSDSGPVEMVESHLTPGQLTTLGYTEELKRNRSLLTLLLQLLAMTAIPYGEGGALISAIYGGGPLSIFVGWLVVCFFDQCVAVSLAEIASRYPTAAGPYHWTFYLAKNHQMAFSFLTGWIWLVGNWTITLSVNFGFAALISATVKIYHPDSLSEAWEVLLVFYLICVCTFIICAYGNRFLPMVDTFCAYWTVGSVIAIMISLSVIAKEGRHSVAYTLGYYDDSFSGWGDFTFFIGLLPAAYCFSGIGLISSMAEEVSDPQVQVSKAMTLCIPVGGIVGLFFIIPICATLPSLDIVLQAPGGQVLPFIFHLVTGSPGGALALMISVLIITAFCSISITVAASRCTWAFARDNGIPLSTIWSRVDKKFHTPIWALFLLSVIQMALGLISLGSTTAFNAFVSVGVQAMALSYAVPILLSLCHGRQEVLQARWNVGTTLGVLTNYIALGWIVFELVLFSMPTVLPVDFATMNYASVVLVGMLAIGAVWYMTFGKACMSAISSFPQPTIPYKCKKPHC